MNLRIPSIERKGKCSRWKLCTAEAGYIFYIKRYYFSWFSLPDFPRDSLWGKNVPIKKKHLWNGLYTRIDLNRPRVMRTIHSDFRWIQLRENDIVYDFDRNTAITAGHRLNAIHRSFARDNTLRFVALFLFKGHSLRNCYNNYYYVLRKRFTTANRRFGNSVRLLSLLRLLQSSSSSSFSLPVIIVMRVIVLCA